MAVQTPSGLLRDPQQVKKGGSNRLEVGLTDAQADAIWQDRYAFPLNDVDDTNDILKVDGDRVFDVVEGSQWRVRAGTGGSTANGGLYTVQQGVTFDPSGGTGGGPITEIPVGSSLSAASITDPVFVEPVNLAGGWHSVGSLLQGGSITNERDVERIFDETDTEIAQVVNTDEYAIARTVMENGEWFKLLLDWLENNHAPVRDLLPVDTRGDYYAAAGGDLYAELRAYPHVGAEKESYEETVARDEARTHEVTLNASKAPDTNPNAGKIAVPPHGAVVVNIDDQTAWDTDYSGLSEFKDDAFSTTRTTS
jgi:hypothetical protein